MPISAEVFYTRSSGGVPQPGHPPLLLIHGAGGSHLHWPAELRRMPGEVAYAVDLPGHGRSLGKSSNTIQEYVRSLVKWMTAVGLDSAIVVGHSMGGAISLTMALTHPERVAAMVLIGTGARLRVNPVILELTSDEERFHEAVELMAAWTYSEEVDAELVQIARAQMAQVPTDVMHNDFLACDSFDVMDQLGRIGQPTLIICGSEDLMTPVKYSRYLEEHIPDARFYEINSTGHMVMLEQPVAVAERVRDFVQERFSGD
ncbi:MAG: alpha/beta fold hydrolase [Anaerolineales bacterium]|nr:alpha/beta fold hydrolase [Anaerolineales bacterium]